MRALHLHTGNLYGGVETMLTCMQRHAAATPALTMTFALMQEGRLAADLRASGGDVVMLPAARLRHPLEILRTRKALLNALTSGGYDVVINHSTWVQAVFGSIVRKARIPMLFWQHNAFEDRHWIERLAAAAPPDFVISNSHYTASTLSRVFPDAGHEVVYPPVERPQPESAEALARARRELDTPQDDVVIIQASRMEAWKGQLLLAEALGRLADVPGWTCWQVGGAQRESEKRYERELRERVAELGLEERVRFTGHRHDVSRLLAAADLHCQPNLLPESFGITFVEALYRGLPVVTTAMGGPLEIVDESCGMLVARPDSGELAGALRTLIETRDLRRSLSVNGPARAAMLCDPGAQASRLHEVCSRLA